MNKEYIHGLVQNNVEFVFKTLLNFSDKDISLDSSFSKDFGLDDLDAVEIIMALEYTLNISIEDEFWIIHEGKNNSLNPSLTIGDVIDYCVRKIELALAANENSTVPSLSECNSDNKNIDAQTLYSYLMRYKYDWSHNPKLAEIIYSSTCNISEKFEPIIGTKYFGEIDWTQLHNKVRDTFGINIPKSRARRSDIWNIYINIIGRIIRSDLIKLVDSYKLFSKEKIDESSLSALIDAINTEYNVTIKPWQVTGTIKGKPTRAKIKSAIIEIVKAKSSYPLSLS